MREAKVHPSYNINKLESRLFVYMFLFMCVVNSRFVYFHIFFYYFDLYVTSNGIHFCFCKSLGSILVFRTISPPVREERNDRILLYIEAIVTEVFAIS